METVGATGKARKKTGNRRTHLYPKNHRKSQSAYEKKKFRQEMEKRE